MDNHTNHGDSAVQSSALPHAAVTLRRVKEKAAAYQFLRRFSVSGWLCSPHSATSGFSVHSCSIHWFHTYQHSFLGQRFPSPYSFMISGALLLGKRMNWHKWSLTNLAFSVLVIFSFISYVAVYRNLNPGQLCHTDLYVHHGRPPVISCLSLSGIPCLYFPSGGHSRSMTITLSLSYRIKSFLCGYPFFLPYL